jgi:hypothetical protein
VNVAEFKAENERLAERLAERQSTLTETRKAHDIAWLNFRAMRGQMEFYWKILTGEGLDPRALWLEHLANDEKARRRWAVDENGSVAT